MVSCGRGGVLSITSPALQVLLAPDRGTVGCSMVPVQCTQVLHDAGALRGLAASMRITCKLAAIKPEAGALALLTPGLLASCRLAAQVRVRTDHMADSLQHTADKRLQSRGRLDARQSMPGCMLCASPAGGLQSFCVSLHANVALYLQSGGPTEQQL